jgi:hypothetical protein
MSEPTETQQGDTPLDAVRRFGALSVLDAIREAVLKSSKRSDPSHPDDAKRRSMADWLAFELQGVMSRSDAFKNLVFSINEEDDEEDSRDCEACQEGRAEDNEDNDEPSFACLADERLYYEQQVAQIAAKYHLHELRTELPLVCDLSGISLAVDELKEVIWRAEVGVSGKSVTQAFNETIGAVESEIEQVELQLESEQP